MASQRITQLTQFSTLATGDLLLGVDISDTTQAPEGTTKSLTVDLLNSSLNFYPSNNPSGYITSIPSDVVRTSGAQTISGVKTFYNITSFPSGVSGIHYGNGGNLTNVVNSTGTQTVLGSKTFSNYAVFNAGLDVNGTVSADAVSCTSVVATNIFNSAGVAINLNSTTRDLVGDWTNDSEPVTTSFSTDCTLTRIVPEVPEVSAGIAAATISIGSVPSDSSTFSVSFAGVGSATFEFYDSSQHASEPYVGGNIPIYFTEFSESNMSVALLVASAISGWHSTYYTTTVEAGTDVHIVSNSTGSSYSINVSGIISGAGSGSDGSAAVPESGTRQATLIPSLGSKIRHIEVCFAKLESDNLAWATADISIGYYFSGSDSFYPVLVIPMAELLGNGSILAINDGIAIYDFNIFRYGQSSCSLIARTTSPGNVNTPADETTGSAVTICVKGFTSV